MSLPDLKELNKIIALCRKQGVKVIKIGEIELTLGEDTPKKPRGKNAVKAKTHEVQGEVESEGWDSLPEEDKLFWSATGGTPVITGNSGEDKQ